MTSLAVTMLSDQCVLRARNWALEHLARPILRRRRWRHSETYTQPARKRVLWVTKGLTQGGMETLLVGLSETDALREFEIHSAYALTWRDELVADLKDRGVVLHNLHGRRTSDITWVWNLAKLVHRGRFTAVHAHSPLIAVVVRLLVRLPGRSRPLMVTTEHNLRRSRHTATRLANDVTVRLDDVRFAVSRAVADSWEGTRGRRGLEPLLHWPPVSGAMSRQEARRYLGIDDDSPTIVSVVNMRPEKNLSCMLLAMTYVRQEIPGVRLVIVGDGPEQPKLAWMVGALGLEGTVDLVGRIPNAQRLLRAGDVGALSSTFEGLPVFVMECMSLGIPVVSTAVGGVGEIVLDGETGLLVRTGDHRGLAKGLQSLLLSHSCRTKCASRALDLASQHSLEWTGATLAVAYGERRAFD